MAAYDKNTSFKGDCELKLVNIPNTIDRIIMLEIMGLVNDELVAVLAAQSTYTLQVSVLTAALKLVELSNNFRVEAMQLWLEDLWTELGLVVTNGNSYTKTVYVPVNAAVSVQGVIQVMKRRFDGFPNILVKQVMHDLIDIIDTELDAMEASDADT